MDTEDTLPPRRRAADPVIDHLHECVEGLKGKVATLETSMAENTAMTKEVRDILATFRTLATVAKWFTAIAGAVAAGFAMFRSIKGN